MIKVERFINQLMTSNCYIVVDEVSKHCLCVDPASEKSEREIAFVEEKSLILDYIFLTHEHTDHTWGVNALIDKYPLAKVVSSELCKEALPKESKVYFQFYYDDPNYSYNVSRVDCTTEELEWQMKWCGHKVVFIPTPGHSPGSVCLAIDNKLFGGDTLMPYKPFIKKKNGGSRDKFWESIRLIQSKYPKDTIVYPGHGEISTLTDIISIISTDETD